jgi:thioredoxin-like negative regulator of GroEL
MVRRPGSKRNRREQQPTEVNVTSSEELATELKGVANVAKVDVTGNRDIGNRFDIKGFPTIKFFHHDTASAVLEGAPSQHAQQLMMVTRKSKRNMHKNQIDISHIRTFA